MALQLFGVIQQLTNQTIERDRQYLETVSRSLGAARRDDGPLLEELRAMRRRIDELETQPEEDEGDDEEPTTSEGPFRPGEPVAEQAKTMILNELAKHGKDLVLQVPQLLALLKEQAVEKASAAAPSAAS